MTIEKIFNEYLAKEYSALFYTPPVYEKGNCYLFVEPDEVITARNRDELFEAFDLIQKQIENGRIGYGFLTYEAGHFFEEKLLQLGTENNSVLLRFCFFDNTKVRIVKPEELDFVSGDNQKNYDVSNFNLNKSKEDFEEDIARIKNYISHGDTYQVNYTVRGSFKFSGSYSSLFKTLVFNQSARYTAFINNKDEVIISVSPELFFSVLKNEIITKPMKGTISRGINNLYDRRNINTLQNSEKNKAENLMILDLLRNDAGRISKFGTVKVTDLFKVEKYESLFQMISETRSTLQKGMGFKEILTNIFPSGSITGAPKIRTMEIIHELENAERGIYTGTIGLVEKDKMIFNVAIRTLKINKKSGAGEIGLGSGIVWDSGPADEYNETLLKSKFILEPDDYFELFETMLVENKKIFLFDMHLERLKDAANYFLFKYDERKIKSEVFHILEKTNKAKKYRLKLNLNKWGNCSYSLKEYFPFAGKIKVIISANIISSQNRFQYFKTTNRKLYDDEYRKYSGQGFFDVLFFNENGHLTEGAITNIFIKKNGKWITPALDCGILPGVYRKHFISQNHPYVIETQIAYEDLFNSEEIVLTNSLRGEIKVDQLFTQSN